MASEAIAVRKLTKTYGARQGSVVALDDISFSIAEADEINAFDAEKIAAEAKADKVKSAG